MPATSTADDLQGSASAIVAALPKVAQVDGGQAFSVADAESRRVQEETLLVLYEIRDELRLFNARSNQ